MGNFISFAEWGINNLDENFLDKYWDWDKNELNPYEISYGSHKRVWIKCRNKDYHNSYEIECKGFTRANRRCPYCANKKVHPLDSFARYHIDNTDPDFLEKYWDYKKNTVNPYEISPKSGKQIWIKCQEVNYHESYKIGCKEFTNGCRCPYCNTSLSHKIHPLDSFAQYHIDNTDSKFLEKYWDYEKNTVNPFEVGTNSHIKIWIKCQNVDYHESYVINCNDFTRGKRCSYCARKNVHYFDSLGFLYHDIAKMIVEDKRNGLTWEDTYKIAPYSSKKFYFKCLNCKNDSRNKKQLCQIIRQGFSCEFCSDGLPITEKFLTNVLEQLNINFITQLNKRQYDWCNNKKYDFYIPNLNMIIETHGVQHYKSLQEAYL